MRIVLTGSSGRVGRAIYVNLARKHHVVSLDVHPSSMTTHVGSILDKGLLKKVFNGADVIIHTAALHAPHVPLFDESQFYKINVEGTKCVLETAVSCKVPRIVFTSTTALYGYASQNENHAVWIDEETTPKPRTIYHKTKILAEEFLVEAAKHGGPCVRILRMSRCFPEPVSQMIQYRLHRGIDARDVASAHHLALTNGGANHETYIISGKTPFLREDCDLLKRNLAAVLSKRAPGVAQLFKEKSWQLPASIGRVYDSSKALDQLGWDPIYGFREVMAMYDRCSSEVLPNHCLGTTLEA